MNGRPVSLVANERENKKERKKEKKFLKFAIGVRQLAVRRRPGQHEKKEMRFRCKKRKKQK